MRGSVMDLVLANFIPGVLGAAGAERWLDLNLSVKYGTVNFAA